MRKGALQHCVLALLRTQPRYGIELVQLLARQEGLAISGGTVYPIMSRLRSLGHVQTEWQESPSGPPRRYYAITPSGAMALAAFEREWRTFRDGIDAILQEEA
jgi:PadR family transcriptional regulator PadR